MRVATTKLIKVGMAILLVIALTSILCAQAPRPLTQGELIKLIKQNKKDLPRAAAVLAERGVDFDLDKELKIEKKLRKAGADDALIEEVWKAGPTYKASLKASLTTPTGAQLEASPEEAQSYHQIQNELDPDGQLQMVSEFESKYPESQFLSYVYTQAAKAFQQKAEPDKVLEYGEKSLKLDPSNLFSLVMVSLTLAQPGMLQGSGADREKRLMNAEIYSERALQLIEQMQKPETEAEEQFQNRKTAIAVDAHFARGMVHLLRDEHDKAAAQYEKAISLAASPNPQHYYRLGEAYESSGKVDEAIKAFTKVAELAPSTALETYANRRLKELHLKK